MIGMITMITKRFKDRVVVITGGSNGIGLASAQRFADEGAQVYITARRQEILDQAISQIGLVQSACRAMSRTFLT